MLSPEDVNAYAIAIECHLIDLHSGDSETQARANEALRDCALAMNEYVGDLVRRIVLL